jgi:superfamily II DNA or RNA helicase
MSSLNDLNRVLTAHGYAIKKSSLTPTSMQTLRKELTVAPLVNQKFQRAAGPATFTVYTESATRFYVPRCWGKTTYGPAEAESLPEGAPLRSDIQFIGKPYDYQKAIVDQFIDTAGGNGLICVPCGRGKTFMAIWTAMRLGKKFLIVVDKEFLMNQWKGELEALVPGIRVGILQEDKCQIGEETRVGKPMTIPQLKQLCKERKLKVTGTRDELLARIQFVQPDFQDKEVTTVSYDCTIAMIQTLVQRDFPQGTFKDFAFTIFDECHHLGAAHFSKALLKVQTKYMLGLSATPTRDDGLTKVFEWFLGKPVYWEKTREPDPQVVVRLEQFSTDNPDYNEVPTDYKGEPVLARLLTKIVECPERNKHLAKLIAEIGTDEKRRILVLSERIGHLEAIEQLLKPSGLTMSYYIGGMKEEEREAGARVSRVLLASYAMASEAMNIKHLNCVVLASPRKKVEQSTGRILRVQKHQREVHPLIVDVVDSHGMYQGQWRKRSAYYKKCAYRIQVGDQDEAEASEPEEQEEPQDGDCLILSDSD